MVTSYTINVLRHLTFLLRKGIVMERIISNTIENVGRFEYYLTKTSVDNINTYGVAVKNISEGYTEIVFDIWTEKEPVLKFINLIAKNQVTCVHLRQLCEEFVEELYSM